jgi:WD40 repeat protein
VAFSPDARRLASASNDHTAKVRDAASGQELFALRGDAGIVFHVANSPDSHRIASASEDGTVKVWDGTPVTPARPEERLALSDQLWPGWQPQEAELCERQKQWFSTLWHLNQLLARNPQDVDLRTRRDAAQAALD